MREFFFYVAESKPEWSVPNMEEEKTSEAKETKVVNHEVEKTLSTSSRRQDKCKSNFYYRKEARKQGSKEEANWFWKPKSSDHY